MIVPFWSVLLFLGAAALLALWRPRVALLLPLVFHQGYLMRALVPLGQLSLPTTLLEGLIGIAVLSASVEAWKRIRRGGEDGGGSAGAYVHGMFRELPRGVVVLVGLFLIAATVSAAVAPHPRTAWGQWKAFIVEPILYAFVLLPLLRDPDGRRAAARALLLGGIVSAGLSLLIGFASFVDPFSFLRSPFSLDFGRFSGIYDVPNSLALVLAPLTAFAVSLTVTPDASGLRRLARGSLVLFVPALLATQSFGGLLGVSVGSLLALRWRGNLLSLRKADSRLMPVLLLMLMVGGLVWQARSGKLQHAVAPNSPLVARLQIWTVSLELIRDHPLLGTGLGTFEPAYQEKLGEVLRTGSRQSFFFLLSPSSIPLEWLVRDPHNVVLSFWLQTGLLGLLAMGGLLLVAFRHFPKFLRLPAVALSEGGSISEVGKAAAAALVTLLVFGLVDVPYFKNDLSLLWWTYVSLTLSTSLQLEKKPQHREEKEPSEE